MADPRDTPLPSVWSATTPDSASIITTGADQLVARCGRHVVGFDRKGRESWTLDLGEGAGDGTLLQVVGETVVTDTRTGAKRTTELVGVRGGKIAYRTAMECQVGNQASCLIGDELFVLGVAPAKAGVLRSISVATGKRRLDRAHRGRDLVSAADRLLILDSFAEPGIVSTNRDGEDERIVEPQPAQEFALWGTRLVSSLRTGPAPQRTAQMRDLASGKVLWTYPCHGAVVAIHEDLAVHIELVGGALLPVARDAATGEVRWRGAGPVGDDVGTFRFSRAFVVFTHGMGTTLYRRTSGELVGELVAAYALAADDRHIYMEGSERIACLDGGE